MSYGKLFSDLKVRFRAMAKKPAAPKTSGSAPEPQPLSAADRDLMINMLAGITAQVAHEQRLDAARGTEPVSVRLVPQVPVRDRNAGAGWIGGGACLPVDVQWPMINDARSVGAPGLGP